MNRSRNILKTKRFDSNNHQIIEQNLTLSKLSPLARAVRISLLSLSLTHGASQAAMIEVKSNMDDDMSCTIRDAIDSINAQSVAGTDCTNTGGDFGDGDTIFFSDSLATNNITLLSGQLAIDPERSVKIEAANIDGGIQIDGNDLSRVFGVYNAQLTLSNITISGGSEANRGGGIYAVNQSTVVLDNCTVTSNSADRSGGGIHVGLGTSLTLNNSRIQNNRAYRPYLGSGDMPGLGQGGGISGIGLVTISLNEAEVSENYSRYSGGGIYAINSSQLTIEKSSIFDNSTGLTSYAQGIGIAAFANTVVDILGSTISSNTVGSTLSAGALFIEDGSASLINSTVSGNSGRLRSASIEAVSSDLDISNSTIANNSAGIFLSTSTVTLSNSIVADSARSIDISINPLGSASLVNSDAATIIEQASFGGSRTGDPGLMPLAFNGSDTQTHALGVSSIARNSGILNGALAGFENCTATDQRGQARNNGDNNCDVGAVEFASIEVDSNGDTVSGANCSLRAAIESINAGELQGGCETSDGSSVVDLITFSSDLPTNTITLLSSELGIQANKVVSIDASDITAGITIDANEESRVLSITSSVLSANNLKMTGGVNPVGAGIYANSGASVLLQNSEVFGNRADAIGGGLFGSNSSSFSLLNSRLYGNVANDGAGVFLNSSSSIRLDTSTVDANQALNNGGGLSLNAQSGAELINSTVSRNRAGANGGGFFNGLSARLNISNSTISSNTAAQLGGGFYTTASTAENSRGIYLYSSTVANNSLETDSLNGAGLHLNGFAYLYLSNTIVGDSINGLNIFTGSNVNDYADQANIVEGQSFSYARMVDPGLLPLADNGGTTLTHALREDSPARGTADSGGCFDTDQIGQVRDSGDDLCDVGAIEFFPTEVEVNFFVIPLENGRAVVVPL